MITDLAPAPDIAFSAACSYSVGADEDDVMVATNPICVHEIRANATAGWDRVLPHVGWVFPVFRGEEIIRSVFVALPVGDTPDPDKSYEIDNEDFSGAMETAFSIAAVSPYTCRVRLVRSDADTDTFWIEGENDTFVSTEDGRVMAAPEFIATITGALNPELEQLIWDAGEASSASEAPADSSPEPYPTASPFSILSDDLS